MKFGTFLFRTAFAAALLACSLPGRALAIDTIPFTPANGLIQVQGSVDGSAPVPMLVNLGAGIDVLSSNVGRRFVRVNGKYVSLRLSGERVDLPIGNIDSLTVGGIRLDVPHIGIWSGLDGTGIDGLISATAFRNITTTFDFRTQKVIIEDAESFPERIRIATKIPLILQDDLGIALGVFARFDFGGGKIGLCEIDTGSAGITIDKTFATANGLADGGKARVASIALAGARNTAIDAPPISLGNLIYDCDVGNSFWAGRSFTLDLQNRYMYVLVGP
ncbi:MAG TPA: hypothetical protein VIX83_05160 [Candidatus Cybelea sp.]